jgi:hypothetical protein
MKSGVGVEGHERNIDFAARVNASQKVADDV